METPQKLQTMRETMDDILSFISWGNLANKYFDKSSSWLYQKMNGKDGNGKPTQFTESEKEILRGALCDLADRLRRASEQV